MENNNWAFSKNVKENLATDSRRPRIQSKKNTRKGYMSIFELINTCRKVAPTNEKMHIIFKYTWNTYRN